MRNYLKDFSNILVVQKKKKKHTFCTENVKKVEYKCHRRAMWTTKSRKSIRSKSWITSWYRLEKPDSKIHSYPDVVRLSLLKDDDQLPIHNWEFTATFKWWVEFDCKH